MDAALLLLADGRFPTGGHAYSAGTESAVAVGDVVDLPSLERYLAARLATTGRVEAGFAAAAASDRFDLGTLDDEYSARIPSPYLRSISRRQGRQLIRAASALWPEVEHLARTPDGPHQAIAMGVATRAAGGSSDDAATMAVHHLAGAVATAAVRMLGLDPIAVAAVQLRRAEQAVAALLAERPWDVHDPSDLPADGGILTEILGERHGSLDARLFVA